MASAPHSVLADVLEMFPQITSFDTGTENITDTRVTSIWIPEADAVIDSTLRPHYDVANYDAADIPLLRWMSKHLTASTLHNVIYATSVNITMDPQKPDDDPSMWGVMARKTLANLAKGVEQLATTRISAFDIGVFEDHTPFTLLESQDEIINRVVMSEDF